MKARSLLIKVIVLSILWVFLFSNTGVVASQKKRTITATGEGVILNYSERIYWDGEQFNQEYKKYSENKVKYLENFIESFSNMFLEAGLEATDWIIFFNSQYDLGTGKAVDSTLVRCKINGAASGTAESPYFRTEWLLMPILPRGVDLYNFKYLTDKTLVYEDTVNRTPINITFKFSKPISHCHYHIWYK